ncbi:MAG: iron ABC transporter permease [Pseudomonadota bacterium]
MEQVLPRAATRNRSDVIAFAVLGGLVVVLAIAGLALGPVPLSPAQVIGALFGAGDAMESAIVWEIRLPRIVLAIAVGSALALSGAALQGVLRNPLADPGLIGVTGGASLGAVATIVLGGLVAGSLPAGLRPYMLPISAFLGAGLVIAFVFGLARRHGETSVATLILAGVAVNAIAGAAIGAMVYVSDDQQLRDLTFWTMGALGGAGWTLVMAATILTLGALPLLLLRTRDLDLFQLGERAAFHAGLDVEQSKMLIGLATAVAVGAVTAAAGPIGFIGLVAPHLVRLALGPRHAVLLPASLLTGVALVLAADLAVRLAVPPAEPPIGLATSLIGGPFFLWLLLRGQGMRRHA